MVHEQLRHTCLLLTTIDRRLAMLLPTSNVSQFTELKFVAEIYVDSDTHPWGHTMSLPNDTSAACGAEL